MPDDPAREKPPADESAEPTPKSPEEMMGALLNPAPADDEPTPPEDYDPQLSEDEIKRYARPEDLPVESEQPPAPKALDPAIREVAQRFIEMRNQAATLADLLDKEEISFEDYQRLLYEAMVQDEGGVWWMIDAENEDWYRHDPDRNQWEVDYPAALREYERHQSAPFNGDETLTEYDLPATLGAPAAGDLIYDERGVKIGRAPPTKDELYTVPGAAALADEIPGQQPTLAAEARLSGTIPAPAQVDPDDVIPRAIDTDYELGASPVVRELLGSQRSRRVRLLTILLAALLMMVLAAGIIAAGVIMMWYRDTVAPFSQGIADLVNYSGAYQTARIFDSEGNLLAALNSQETGARTAIPLEQVSPYMIHAIVSQENERFFDDPGFDPVAIVRAFIQNVSGGGIESGASTITQQIARNLVLQDREVTIQRKLKEILVALEIANRYDKNFILELYLNEIFFANQNYGVEAAANFYFSHSADQLNFAEAALLASIVPSPTQHDPVANRPTAVAGMRSTMRKMIAVGCLQFQHGDWLERGPFCIINNAEDDLVRTNAKGEISGGLAILQIAEIETTAFQPGEYRARHPHFVDFVRAAVEAELGEEALFQLSLIHI